jgi:hypothetical protein
MGAMTSTQSYEGVRHVVVDNFVRYSITWCQGYPAGLRRILNRHKNDPNDAVLEQIPVRHDRECFRIQFSAAVLSPHKGRSRLDEPDGLD